MRRILLVTALVGLIPFAGAATKEKSPERLKAHVSYSKCKSSGCNVKCLTNGKEGPSFKGIDSIKTFVQHGGARSMVMDFGNTVTSLELPASGTVCWITGIDDTILKW